MSINVNAPTGVDHRQTATTPTDAASKTQVDYQSFLKLLVAQMKNQDPTNPMDSTQYMAQLAVLQPGRAVGADEHQARPDAAIFGAGSGRRADRPHHHLCRRQTTGKVAEVRLISNGIVAVLEDGKEITVGPGVTISRHDRSRATFHRRRC